MLISQIIPPKAKQGELPLIFFNDSTVIIELERIIAEINHNGPINNDDLEKLSYIKEFHNELFKKYESSLMFSLGLFYKTSIPKTIWDLAFGTYAKAIEIELNGIYTPVQASAFKQIDSNKYFSFSAPTSAGKSHLFRKLIKDEKGDILIILPSRALIAEYLILVKESLKDEKDVLVLQFIEDVNQAKTSRRVYIVTPERCKELFRELSKPNNRIHISLALFDEAQISEEPIRGIRFDSLVRRINRTIDGVKIVFTHPFIENPEAQLSKHNNEFSGQSSSLSYDQNAVGKIFFFTKESKFFYFSPYELKKRLYDEADIDCVKNKLIQGKTLLVYVSKKSIYDHTFRKDFEVYIDCCPKITNLDGIAIIDELKEYLGVTDSKGDKYSLLIDLMGQGVVIHHGSIPLRARLLIEKFIKEEHAKICFSTSTLQQGVNMPFDMVWIDNFRFDGNGRKDKDVDDRVKSLALKNLIGRAGRSSNEKKDFFDYGYVIIEYKNLPKFIQRLNISPTISSNSLLDSDFTSVDEDVQDIVEAIKNNSFDDETNLTKSQLDRLSNEETMNNVKYILDTLFPEGIILAGEQYYDLGDYKRRKIQTAFKDIYVAHLRRKELKSAEKAVLSTSIPILLWQIQGKSFKEIISLRHSFLARKKEQGKIKRQAKAGEIPQEDVDGQIVNMSVRYTQAAATIPDSKLRSSNIFAGKNVREIDYDRLVCDTYDYIDKVISLSISDPLSAACMLYYNEHHDERAKTLRNYLRYGTNDEKEIWLLKYGFTFEEIDWLCEYVNSIDEQKIIFSDAINTLEPDKRDLTKRYE